MGAFFSSQGSNKTGIYYPHEPAQVKVAKDRAGPSQNKSLRQLVEERCPSLLSKFVPPLWLFNGHLQTLYCVIGDFTQCDKVVYSRTYIQLVDGGTLGLDMTPAKELPETTPIIVVMHGLTGGSYEAYLRAVLAPACSPVSKGGLGYRAIVVNFRGCAGVPLTSPQFYSAGWTNDLRQALIYISKTYPNAPLIGLGFSLGANVLVRYLAEEKEESRLSSAAVLGCPWDIGKNNDALESSLAGRYLYSKGMATNLLTLLKRHASALTKDMSHPVASAMLKTLALKSPTLEQFDDTFTRVAGGGSPLFPFASAKDYYHTCASHYLLPQVRVPLLTMNADDDPVVRAVPLDLGVQNPYVIMVLTRGGGHLGWFTPGPDRTLKRYFVPAILEWLRMAVEDILPFDSAKREIYLSEKGFLKEVGRQELGCRVIDGGGLVTATEDSGMIFQGL
ncbi:Alpha/Beta hydrolase protein [Mycena floridula]|nr:Alpha/Beta hydrolase protein [Mycena floridula]